MIQDHDEKWYTVPEAAEYLGFSQTYLRTLVRKGTLIPLRVPTFEGSLVTRYVFSESMLEAFLNEAPHKSRRRDGRNKFVVYIHPDEYPRVLEALRDHDLGEVAQLLLPANKVKFNQ